MMGFVDGDQFLKQGNSLDSDQFLKQGNSSATNGMTTEKVKYPYSA